MRWQLSESVIDSIAASYKAKAVYDLAHSQTQAAMVAAASALTAARGAQLRAEKALRDLYSALSDRVPAVRYNAYLALKAITGDDFGEDPKAWRARALGGHGD